jgi:hypothetical protein
VLAIAESFREIAFELTSVVGLPGQVAERDAIAIQVLLDARGEDRAGRGTTALGESSEEQTAADVARGVLNNGQVEPLGLQPVPWDLVEILGVGADLLKQSPACLDVSQVLFSLVFATAFWVRPCWRQNRSKELWLMGRSNSRIIRPSKCNSIPGKRSPQTTTPMKRHADAPS